MKKHLMLSLLALSYSAAYAESERDELIGTITEYVENCPSLKKHEDENGKHIIEHFNDAYQTLSPAHREDVLNTIIDLKGRYENTGASIAKEVAAVALGTYALKKTLSAYFLQTSGSLRSFIGWTAAGLGAIGTYIAGQLYLSSQRNGGPEVMKRAEAGASRILTLPAVITSTAGLALVGAKMRPLPSRLRSHTQALFFGGMVGGCGGWCYYSTKKRLDDYKRIETLSRIFERLEHPADYRF